MTDDEELIEQGDTAMVELNRVDEVQRFRTYKIYGKHHLPHYGEHKLVATIHMNTGDNSLADCENLPVLFMNAQTYRDDAMRLRSEIEQKDREISRLQAGVEQALRELKSCPFCGGEAQYSEFQDALTSKVLADIMCSANCLVGPAICEHPKDEAIAAWNTRVGDSDV